MTINSFTGENRFLSNFYMCNINVGPYGQWPSAEHFYQAMKTKDKAIREKFRQLPNALEAKKLGKKIKIRDDWNKIKLDVMRYVLKYKFQIPLLKQKLLSTGNHTIIEGNWWNDTFWGVCNNQGQNHLGKLLMELRDELKASSNSWL